MKIKTVIIGCAALVLLAGALAYVYFGGKARGKVLASVNGEEITVDRFLQEVEKTQEPARAMFKEEPAGLLDIMIMRTLLLQEVKKQGVLPGKEEKAEDAAIQEFLQKKFSSPPTVDKEELEAFYEVFKDRMGGMSLEQAAPMLEQVIRQQKQEVEYVRYMEEIRKKASVEISQERLKTIASKTPDPTHTEEDFSKARKSGRPVLVDFGSNTCIPCRQLRPILHEIQKEKEGKLEVLVIDIYKNQNLAKEFGIQAIPTVIFFDSKGKEVFRHQGFMPKTAILEQLIKMGVA
ncbi:MAG: thioredoxin domain-containing protein [Thermodesulfobacteriota bacterium]